MNSDIGQHSLSMTDIYYLLLADLSKFGLLLQYFYIISLIPLHCRLVLYLVLSLLSFHFNYVCFYFLSLSFIGEVSDLVDRAGSHAVENKPAESWGSFVRIQKRAQNNSSNLQSLFKKRILESMSKNVEYLKPLGEL